MDTHMNAFLKLFSVLIVLGIVVCIGYVVAEKNDSPESSIQISEDEVDASLATTSASSTASSDSRVSDGANNVLLTDTMDSGRVTQDDSGKDNAPITRPAARFVVSSTTLSVVSEGSILQTLTLDGAGQFAFDLQTSSATSTFTPFILDYDVNFDGYNDVAMLTSTGYAGVNYFYDFYLYNPHTQTLVKDLILQDISHPEFDLENKKIVSSYRSGPQWYSQTFQWNGSAYIKLDPVAELSNDDY